jgi:hypothetical protein
MAIDNLTLDQISEFLSYEALTGQFTRIAHCKSHSGRRSNRSTLGVITRKPNAGGYLVISIFNKSCYAHRLAWLFSYGEWPQGAIDHINGNKLDNRAANLRLCEAATNQQNIRAAKSGNLTGLLGVTPCNESGRYVASIMVDGRRIHLGRFDTPDLAHAAYLGAKRIAHPHGTL